MTIKAVLNTQRATKESLYPLVIRLFGDQQKRLIYSNFHLKKEWFEDGTVIYYPSELGGVRKQREINRYLVKTISDLKQMALKEPNLTVDEVVNKYLRKSDQQYVHTWFETMIKELEKTKAVSTASNYRSTLLSIQAFLGKNRRTNLLLKDITVEWLQKYYNFLRTDRRLKINSVTFYLRVFRAVYNKAVSSGLIDGKDSPFDKMSYSVQQTRKRAIKRDILHTLLDLREQKLPQQQQEALDALAFSFYARGMNLVDMFRLRKVQIEDGYIVYQRSKTDKLLQIRVTPELQEIIEKYDDPDSSFVLPFLGGSERIESFLTYRNALMRINRNLKIIGRQLGLSYPLTTYVIRHSWASLALESGVSIDVIRQGMGHSSLRTTEIYLSGFDRSTVDTANEKLLQWVSGNGKELNKRKTV